MLIPSDLRRIPSPLLRARLVGHLLDEPRPSSELRDIMVQAVEELLRSGRSIGDIAEATAIDERVLRRLVTRAVAA